MLRALHNLLLSSFKERYLQGLYYLGGAPKFYILGLSDILRERSALLRAKRPSAIKTIAITLPNLKNGGAERVSTYLANMLKNHYKVYVILRDAPHAFDYPLDKDIEVLYIPKANRAPTLARVIRQSQIDCVISCAHWLSNEPTDLIALLGLDIYVIAHIHNRIDFSLIKGNRIKYKTELKLWAVCDGVVTLSNADAKTLNALGANARYIPNPLTFIDVENSASVSAPTCIYIGTLNEPIKRTSYLLRSFAEVARQVKDARLLLVGSATSEDMARYKGLVQSLGIQDSVEFKGRINDLDEIKRLLLSSALHLLPSSFEGYPLVVLEAKMLGLVSILSHMPNLEVVASPSTLMTKCNDDTTACVQAYADLIISSIGSKDALEKTKDLGARGKRELLEAFGIDEDTKECRSDIIEDAWLHFLNALQIK